MAETSLLYCYHCRKHHARNEVRRVWTAAGFRWRCIASIRESRRPTNERDAYGRAKTQENREEARRLALQRVSLSRSMDDEGRWSRPMIRR